MPVSPEMAAELAKTLRAIYVDAEEQLLARIGRALAKGITAPDWAERQLRTVQDVQVLTERLIRDLDKATSAKLAEALRTAYNRGVALAGTDLQDAGMPQAVAFGGIDPLAIEALAATQRGIQNQLRQGLQRIASAAPRKYRDVVDEVAGRMLTGTVSRREAAAQAVSAWAKRGVARFTDTSGRRWDIASYAEMSTRTAAGQAMVQGHVTRLSEAGHDLVQISDAPEECKLCRPWEGKVLSLGQTPTGRQTIDGATVDVAGTLRQAQSDGLFHPNCRHRTMIYVPGRSKPMHDTADPEGDRLRQQQRAKERRVRELKREVAALEPLGDTAELTKVRRKLRAYQADFAQWRKANDRKNLSYRTSVQSR